MIGGDLLGRNKRIEILLDQTGIQFPDQQSLSVLLDQRINILFGVGEKLLGFTQLELSIDPLVDVTAQESDAVLAGHSAGNDLIHIPEVQLIASRFSQHLVASEMTGDLLASDQNEKPRDDSYFFEKKFHILTLQPSQRLPKHRNLPIYRSIASFSLQSGMPLPTHIFSSRAKIYFLPESNVRKRPIITLRPDFSPGLSSFPVDDRSYMQKR